jgi:hypothetical protein
VGDFGTGIRISSGSVVNWDNFVTEGNYFIQYVSGNANAPWGNEAYSGYLDVKGSAGLAYQTAWLIRSGNPQMYTRILNGGSWSPWKEMLRVNDYGVGGVLFNTPLANIDDSNTPSGTYWSYPSTAGTKPTGAGYGYVTIMNESNNTVMRQQYRETANAAVFERYRNGGSWSLWVRTANIGDIRHDYGTANSGVTTFTGTVQVPEGGTEATGAMIIQCGEIAYSDLSPDLVASQQFKFAFPNSVRNIQLTVKSNQERVFARVKSNSLSGFTWGLMEDDTTVGGGVLYWMAIGT